MKRTSIAWALGVCLASFAAGADKVGPKLLEENFAALDPAWGVPSEHQRVEDNRMILKPAPNACFRPLYQGAVFGDIDARVNVSLTQGAESRTGGLIFWAVDGDNYHVAGITADGRYGIIRVVDGRRIDAVPFQAGDALKKGLHAVNEVRVVTQGNSATLSANGKQLATVAGRPALPQTRIGLYADSAVEKVCAWKFWDLLVRKPTP